MEIDTHRNNGLVQKNTAKLKICDIHHYIPTNLITNNENIFTEIYKFENLNEDIKKFFKKYLHITLDIPVPKKNVNNPRIKNTPSPTETIDEVDVASSLIKLAIVSPEVIVVLP